LLTPTATPLPQVIFKFQKLASKEKNAKSKAIKNINLCSEHLL